MNPSAQLTFDWQMELKILQQGGHWQSMATPHKSETQEQLHTECA